MERAAVPNFTKFVFLIPLVSTFLNAGCKSEVQDSSVVTLDKSKNCGSDSFSNSDENCEKSKIEKPSLASIGEAPLSLSRSPHIFWSPAINPQMGTPYNTQVQVIKESDKSVIAPWSDISRADSFVAGLNLNEGQSYILQLRSIDSNGKKSSPVSSSVWVARVGKGVWNSIASLNAPSDRIFHGMVWTGSKMIVWGGQTLSGSANTNTGAVYDPATDSWSSMSNVNAPSARGYFSSIWTGSEMIVWGGPWNNTGARYNPNTNTWTPMSTSGAPQGQAGNSAIWTGRKMIVWGGEIPAYGHAWTNEGASYDPSTNTWSPISNINAPSARNQHAAIWTGSKMIVWGGGSGSNFTSFNDGGIYDPATDSWSNMSSLNAPDAKNFQPNSGGYAWDGSNLIVQNGGVYNALLDSWTPSSSPSHPWDDADVLILPATGNGFSATTWIGSGFFTWGGFGSYNTIRTNTGGIYNSTTDSWVGTSLLNAPAPSNGASAIWTGDKVIIWGGGVAASYTPPQ